VVPVFAHIARVFLGTPSKSFRTGRPGWQGDSGCFF